jgi:hypothetical protein
MFSLCLVIMFMSGRVKGNNTWAVLLCPLCNVDVNITKTNSCLLSSGILHSGRSDIPKLSSVELSSIVNLITATNIHEIFYTN